MKLTAREIAKLLKGEINGDPNVEVSDISKIEEGKPGTLSFLANPKYSRYIYTTNSSIVLVNKTFQLEKEINPTIIKVDDAYEAFATLLEVSHKEALKTGIDKFAYIHETAKIGKNVYIAPFAYVGENVVIRDNVKIFPHVYLSKNVNIGSDTVLASGVKVYNDCQIGERCILHAGVVVGSDGFGFAPKTNSDYKKVPQIGNVIIEDDVEIGSNTTIDRATIGSTIIRKGVKLDNLIQVAHNVEIGEHTVIAAQTGISGSTKIGKDCMIAGQVGLVGHLQIADDVKIGAQSGISSNIKEKGQIYLGSPALKIQNQRKSLAIFRNLPDLRMQVIQLQNEIKELKQKLES